MLLLAAVHGVKNTPFAREMETDPDEKKHGVKLIPSLCRLKPGG